MSLLVMVLVAMIWGLLLAGKGAGGLVEPLTEGNCWLEFQVKWKGWSSVEHPDGTTWQPQKDLNCDKLLCRFVQALRRSGKVPLPGQTAAVACSVLRSFKLMDAPLY